MVTIATLPKPFIGHIGIIQRNAILSWLHLQPRPDVILLGDEKGTAEIAAELNIKHLPSVECNTLGTPFLSSAFRMIEEHAKADLICYSNCDIMLFSGHMKAFSLIRERFAKFLIVGECINLDVRTPVNFQDATWQSLLFSDAKERGKRRGSNADFFLFPRGAFPEFLPLTLGRPFFDNWILYEARRLHLPVIDITPVAKAIHQNHFYSAVAGETTATHKGVEAHESLRLLGGWNHVYWISDATHRLTSAGLRRNIAGTLLITQRVLALKRFLGKLKARLLRVIR